MSAGEVWLAIALIAAGGLALRGLFIVLPLIPSDPGPRLSLVLGLVPAAAFAALLGPLLLAPDGEVELISPSSLAGAAALAIAVRWGNLAASIVGGLCLYVALLAWWP